MAEKKYFNDTISEEERVDADISAKQLASQVIAKFEQEKLAGKNINDVIQGTILREEKDNVEEFNNSLMQDRNFSGHQVDIIANLEHNTMMAQFVSPEGGIADEIVSSPTPPEVTDRLEYNEEFRRIPFNTLHVVDSSSSEEEELSSSSEEDESNPQIRQDDFDNPEESISSIYDLAGDD